MITKTIKIILCMFFVSITMIMTNYPVYAVQTDIPTYKDKSEIPLTEDVKIAISEYCDYYEVKESIVYATITHESRFNADAVGKNDNGTIDSGLMQINSANHASISQKLEITNFYDPLQNIRAGIYMLGELSKKYEDDRQVYLGYHLGENGMLAAWNAGVVSNDASKHKIDLQNYYESIF